MKLNQQLYNNGTLEALAYFDVFDFPLTKHEILKYSRLPNIIELEKYISQLLEREIIFKLGDCYAIRNEPKLVKNRVENATRAFAYHPQAKKKSKLISQFPYVKGVFISGSLSKGVMDKDGDIDFFIVTKANRLWVARTLLILYKKIFLFNSRKYFCINYLVDENSLEIEQKNRFTAVELLSLLPMVNTNLHQDIIGNNDWVQSYFSGNFHENPEAIELKSNTIKSLLETVLNGFLGNKLDDFFMKITLKRWQQKFGHLTGKDFEIALRTNKKVSKHHPSNFQKRVLEAYDQRITQLQFKLDQTSKPIPHT